MSFPTHYVVVCAIALLLAGCGSFFRDAGENLIAGAQPEALVDSLIATLNEEANRERLSAVLDHLIVNTDTSINQLLDRVAVDSFSQALLADLSVQLAESPLPDTLRQLAGALTTQLTTELIDTVLTQLNGERTTRELQRFKAGLLDEATVQLLTARLNQLIAGLPLRELTTDLREDLLGETTKAALAGIVDTSMSIVVARLNADISPVIDDKMSFLQRYAKELLAVLALCALGIIAFVWWQRRKYYKLIGIVAGKIDEIPDRRAYDRLTADIRSKAIEEGLEPTLQNILTEYGIKNSQAWKKHLNTPTDA